VKRLQPCRRCGLLSTAQPCELCRLELAGISIEIRDPAEWIRQLCLGIQRNRKREFTSIAVPSRGEPLL
jgi:hypothetical protein